MLESETNTLAAFCLLVSARIALLKYVEGFVKREPVKYVTGSEYVCTYIARHTYLYIYIILLCYV